MPQTLLFDLDGTLTDSAPGIIRCIAHALESHGFPVASEARLRACVGPPLRASFHELTGSEDALDSLIEAYRARFVERGMFENEVYAGIEELLEGLLELGVALHVVTAKPEPYAERILEHFGLRAAFGAVYGPALEGTRTTKVELLARARAELGFDPGHGLMIGDRSHDIEAARHHGIAGYGVRWGYGSDEELWAAGAARLIDAPADLLEDIALRAAR